MRVIGIFGASGFGREVLPLVRQEHRVEIEQGHLKLVFVDDNATGAFNGHSVVSFEQFLAIPASSRAMTIAVASSSARRAIAATCQASGVSIIEVKAENVVILDSVEIGEGSILTAFVCLTSNIRIGKHFQANLFSYVGHDCQIGDFVTFAPKVCCNGNIVIEDDVYVGTGAKIKQGTPDKPVVLGKGCVIGMGAVVTKSVAPGMTVIGNPARPMNV